MRKIIPCFLILLVISLVGCNKIDNTSSAFQVNKSSELSQSRNEPNNSSEEVVISSEVSTIAESSQDSVSSNVSSSEIVVPSNADQTNNSNNNSINNNKYISHGWGIYPDTGEKIKNSDTYSAADGKVYDSDGDFLYDLNEWGEFK